MKKTSIIPNDESEWSASISDLIQILARIKLNYEAPWHVLFCKNAATRKTASNVNYFEAFESLII